MSDTPKPTARRIDVKELNWVMWLCVCALLVYGGSRGDSGWAAVLGASFILLDLLLAGFHLLLAFWPLLSPDELPSDE